MWSIEEEEEKEKEVVCDAIPMVKRSFSYMYIIMNVWVYYIVTVWYAQIQRKLRKKDKKRRKTSF